MQLQVDAAFGIEVVRPERDPIVLRLAGQVILGKIRSVDGWIRVGADYRDRSVVPLATQHVGGGEASGAAADDHDGSERTGRGADGGRRGRRKLVPDENSVAASLDAPARDRIERW